VHPNIVTIYEVGEDARREFIATEYCFGGSLAAWLMRHPGPLPPRTSARLVRAIAGAVAFAHDAGVVHRDIKPANVLLHPAPPGSEPLLTSVRGGDPGLSVKLGDFGLGKVHEEIDGSDPLTQITRTGSRIGTPAWMAPEQVDPSLGAIGPATDIHALGLLLDRLLTGRPLRGGGTDTEVYRQVLLDEPVPADRVVRGVPRDLAAVAAKCLARRPADRYATAAELAADIDRWLDGRPTLARPLSPLGRTTRLIRRRPVVAALVAVALAAVAAAAWVGLDRGREVARREAELSRQRGLEELRRGFEAVRAGNVAATFQQLEKTRAVDPALADSLAGRWLVRRTQGEREILFTLPAATPGDAKRPRDLYSIVLAPDGRTAAVSGADGSIHLLRGLDGRPTAITVAAHDEVNDVAFSSDGTFLASAGQDGRVRSWRVTEDGLVAVGEARPAAGPLYAAVWSPDGRTLAVGGEDRVVRLVNLDALDDARELFRFTPPAGESPEIESLAFVTADTLAASCGDMVMLLDVATGRVLHECERPNQEKRKAIFGSLVVSPDGTRVMACGTDATARVWDVATGRIVTSLPVHPAWVQGCSFAPDGGQIATACRDGGVRVFDAATGRLVNRLIGHVGRVWSVVYEPAGTLLTAGADGTVRRFDPRVATEPALFRELFAPTSLIAAMAELPGTARGKEPGLVVLGSPGVPFRVDPAAGAGVPIELAGEAHVWRQAVAPRTGRLAVTWLEERPVEVVSRAAIERGRAVAADDATVVRLPDGVATAEAVVCWTPEENLLVGTHAGGLFWLPADLRSSRRIAGINGALRLRRRGRPAWSSAATRR
jgi:WD40 repeat protein